MVWFGFSVFVGFSKVWRLGCLGYTSATALYDVGEVIWYGRKE